MAPTSRTIDASFAKQSARNWGGHEVGAFWSPPPFGQRVLSIVGGRPTTRARFSPLRSIEVELDPLGFAQLTRANEHKGRELKRGARDRHAFVAFDRTQQVPDPLGIGDRRHVLHEHRLQGAAQVRCWIALGAASRDGIPEHLPGGLQCAVCRFDRSARLDPAHRLEQFRRPDLTDRQPTIRAPLLRTR